MHKQGCTCRGPSTLRIPFTFGPQNGPPHTCPTSGPPAAGCRGSETTSPIVPDRPVASDRAAPCRHVSGRRDGPLHRAPDGRVDAPTPGSRPGTRWHARRPRPSPPPRAWAGPVNEACRSSRRNSHQQSALHLSGAGAHRQRSEPIRVATLRPEPSARSPGVPGPQRPDLDGMPGIVPQAAIIRPAEWHQVERVFPYHVDETISLRRSSHLCSNYFHEGRTTHERAQVTNVVRAPAAPRRRCPVCAHWSADG